MGRLLLVAIFATIGFGGPVSAKPDHSGRAQHKPTRTVGAGPVACPPGLSKKNPECMPPGRFKKLFEVGQRVPTNYSGLRTYKALPYELRMRYGGALDPRARYVYDQQYLYRIDPATMVVRQVLRSLR